MQRLRLRKYNFSNNIIANCNICQNKFMKSYDLDLNIITELNKQIFELKSQVNDKENENSQLKSSLSVSLNQNQEFIEVTNNLKIKVLKYEVENRNLVSSIAKLKTKIFNLEKKPLDNRQELLNEINQIREETIKNEKKLVECHNIELNTLKSKLSKLSNDYNEIHNKYISEKEKFNENECLVQKLTFDLQTAKVDYENLTSKYNNVSEVYNKTSQSLKEVKELNEKNESTIDDLEDKIENLETEMKKKSYLLSDTCFQKSNLNKVTIETKVPSMSLPLTTAKDSSKNFFFINCSPNRENSRIEDDKVYERYKSIFF